MKLKLERYTLYGKALYRPMCETSNLFLQLQRSYKSRTKPMFTKREVEVLKKLGYEIELCVPPEET